MLAKVVGLLPLKCCVVLCCWQSLCFWLMLPAFAVACTWSTCCIMLLHEVGSQRLGWPECVPAALELCRHQLQVVLACFTARLYSQLMYHFESSGGLQQSCHSQDRRPCCAVYSVLSLHYGSIGVGSTFWCCLCKSLASQLL